MSITLNATLQDFTGANVGSVANPGKVRITLCNFGSQLPRIAGTSLIARTSFYIEFINGTFSTAILGNDVISPAGTYYTIALLDGAGNVVQSAAYQLSGSGTQNLSSLSPIIFPGQAGANPSIVFSGIPTIQACSGTVDGVNATFTFNAPPSPTPLLALFAGGIFQTPGALFDYNTPTYSGSNIWSVTFTAAPAAGPVTAILFQQPGNNQRTIAAPATIVVSGPTADGTLFCNFSAPGTVTIPSASSAGGGYTLTFKDVSYHASTNPITLSGSIEQGASYVINTNGGSVTIRSDGTAWRVIAKV